MTRQTGAEVTSQGSEEAFIEPAPLPDYSSDGVDLTLIRWMLSLTPAERLTSLEQRIEDLAAIHALNE